MIVIITGSNYKKYLGQGYVEFPENYFWGDDVLQICSAFLIAARTRKITIVTKDAMMIEGFDSLVKDGDGQVTFFLDDVDKENETSTKREIKPGELCILYNAIGRGYEIIDIQHIRNEWAL